MKTSKARINDLIAQLQLGEDRGLYFFNKAAWQKNGFSFRVKKAIEALKPYAFYSINNEPFILFFTNDDSRGIERIHNQAWNFQAPVVIIDNVNEWQIYNGFSLSSNRRFLEKLTEQENIADFSFWNLHSGFTGEKYSKEFKKKRLDTYLLENISTAIDLLIKGGLNREQSNSIIGRLIFARYLIDRGVELDNTYLAKSNERKSFLEIISSPQKLYKFFGYLKTEFNGHLFPITTEERKTFNASHSTILYNLFAGNDLRSGQASLFDLYDFNIIPIELISNIYERFIGREEQNTSQAFYTPAFLVDYILKHTVEKHLVEKIECKVLDPSCGSGIFLVETLRKIIERNISNKPLTDNQLRKLLVNNIFGVDMDANAINVAIFSLYLTLLDYKSPKEIRNFELPPLLGTNFFKANFFSQSLKQQLKIDFDFIVGNPPWKSIKDDNEHLSFVNDNSQIISDYQIAQSFIVNIKNFSSVNTQCGLVVTSKMFYNLKAKNFRSYLLKNHKIFSVLELSSVRELVFKGAIGPGAVIIFQCSQDELINLNNIVTHISLKPNYQFELFKNLTIEKFDHKRILQKYLHEHDWAWKTFVYGNVLDFFFVKRLKAEYKTVNQIIHENKLSAKQGLQIGGGDNNDSHHLIGLPFIDTSKKQLRRYHIDTQNRKWQLKTVHRPRDPEVYSPPALLIKKGLTNNFELVSALNERRAVFTDSITAIRGTERQKNILRSLEGSLNSTLFPYYTVMTGTSAGIEREQAHNEDEKFQYPAVIDTDISIRVKELETLQKKYEEDYLKDDFLRVKISDKEVELNDALFKLYGFSDEDRDLISYASKVSIPLFRGDKTVNRPLKKLDDINEYALVFYKYFSKRYNKPGEFFLIDIYFEKYYLALHFRIVAQKPENPIAISNLENNSKFFKIISTIFSRPENITRELFMQRDIKGFEKDSFYIIKPNECKNWHPAIARLDLMEFIEAILKQSQKQITLSS